VRRLVARLLPLLLLVACPAPGWAASNSAPVVSVRTVPPVSGLALTFENQQYVTDSAGRVQIPRAPGTTAVELLPRIAVGSRHVDSRTIVRFARWFTVGTESYAALDVYRQISWRFVDAGGKPVPFGRIERLVLRSSSGQVRVFRTGLARSHWFFARRVSLIRGKLVKKDLDYSVQRIVVLGADVVNAGQQTFSPESGHSVSFTLAFYALTVRGEDALFGSPAGTHAQLQLPDGSTRELRLSHGQAVVPSLPRGSYTIRLRDGLYRPAQPLVLSRSQIAVVPVVTYLDIIVVGGGLLILALGLLLAGRPYLARRAARLATRRRAPAADGPAS
jgi:hypothetical protein